MYPAIEAFARYSIAITVSRNCRISLTDGGVSFLLEVVVATVAFFVVVVLLTSLDAMFS